MSEETYRRLLENNRRWVAEKNAEDPAFFEELAAEQHPEFLFIGCADSRVPASTIMGVGPGDIFVHRNIANLVVNTDLNFVSVLYYAVDVLKVEHIVVCGHYGCGGVKAAMQPHDLGVLNGWLREIRDVYRLHKEELQAIADEDARYRRLVELNVREQCVNIIKTAVVQRNYIRRELPLVHGWVYDLKTGLIHDQEIPFEEVLEMVREIYDLRLDEEEP